MTLIEPLQLQLVIPKAIETILFLLNIFVIYKQYQKPELSYKPQLYRILMIGLIGWFIYIFLDIFIYIFAPISMEGVAVGSYLSGYDLQFPSLFIVNILRDIGMMGGLIMLWTYFTIPFLIHWGNAKTTKVFGTRPYFKIIAFIISSVIIVADKIAVRITETGVKVNAVFSGISVFSIFLYIIIYFLSSFLLIIFTFKSRNSMNLTSIPKSMKFLIIGVFLMGLGHLYWLLLGVFQLTHGDWFTSDIANILPSFFGHFIWMCSPLFLRQSLNYPYETPIKREDYLKVGIEKFQKYINDKLLSMYILSSDKIIYANEAMANLTNYPRKEIESWTFDQLVNIIYEEDRLEFIKKHTEHVGNINSNKNFREINNQIHDNKKEGNNDKKNDTPFKINVTMEDELPKEFRIICDKKELKWISLYTNSFIIRNERIVQAIFIDITTQKFLEEKIITNEMQNQKIESISMLAGGIAHDFNNILVAILGNINLLQLTDPNDKGYNEILSNLEKGTLRARGLTNQLLTFSKGGAPIKNPSSINDIIKESVAFVLSGSNSKAEFNLEENVPPLNIDAGQINQVLNNIILNAAQAMPRGGIINISGKIVAIDESTPLRIKPGKYYKISIKDHGVGISKENIKKLFDLYFTTKSNRAGLGLPVCLNIIKRHEGTIYVESEENKGSVFHIFLPIHKDLIITPKKNAISASNRTERGYILLMDDDQQVINTLGKMLNALGYDVEKAVNGYEALDKYKQSIEMGKKFDVVIMDLIIPGSMGGKEAINRLIEIDPNVKAIVSSGFSKDPIMSEYEKNNFKGVLSKPYSLQRLKEVVEDVLKQ